MTTADALMLVSLVCLGVFLAQLAWILVNGYHGRYEGCDPALWPLGFSALIGVVCFIFWILASTAHMVDEELVKARRGDLQAQPAVALRA